MKETVCEYCSSKAKLWNFGFNEYGTVWFEVYFCENCANKTKIFRRIRPRTFKERVDRIIGWFQHFRLRRILNEAFDGGKQYDDDTPLNSISHRAKSKDLTGKRNE